LTTLATWFLLPHFPKIDFVPQFFVVKVFVAIKLLFAKTLKNQRTWPILVAHSYGIGRTFIRYPVAHSYGI